jgi:hypothetical protein
MADITVRTEFDRINGRMRLVFSEKINFLELPLDKAIEIFQEITNRCVAIKVISTTKQEIIGK